MIVPRTGLGQGSRRWVLGIAAVAALLVAVTSAGLLGGGEPAPSPPERAAPDSSDPSPGSPAPPRSRVSLGVLPPVAQPGATAAPADRASPVLVAAVRPAEPGRTVVLERSTDGGWDEVARGEQDADGRAVFTDVPPSAGTATRYRATVLDDDGAAARPGPAVDGAGWQQVFADDFAGSTLDATRWSYRALGTYNPEGSRECSMSDESAVGVGSGVLELRVLRDPQRVGDRCVTDEDGTHDYYLNGHVSTEDTFGFRYGVAAARVKFQRERGQHGAFWMQRDGSTPVVPGDPGRSGAEIDVAEYFGEGYQDGGLASFVYYTNAAGEDEKVGGLQPRATRLLPPGDAWWDSYHVFSVEWTPERYVFRVDGREFYRTTEGVSGVDQFLVLSLLSSDWELDRIDPSTLPATMSVDWVRVWQRRGG